jgi:hypothetical protein
MNFLLHCFDGPEAGKFLCEHGTWSEHPDAARMRFPIAAAALRHAKRVRLHLNGVQLVCEVPDGRYNILLPLGRSERRRHDTRRAPAQSAGS